MRKKYTIVFIPPDDGPTRQIQFSDKGKLYLKIGIISLAGVMAGLLTYDIVQWNYIQEREAAYAQVDELEAELQEHEQTIDDLSKKNTEMADNLSEITALEAKVASILKLEPPPTMVSPNRGTRPMQQSYDPLAQGDQNAALVETHLALWQDYYTEAVKYQDKLDHTPSILPMEGEIASEFGYRKNPFGGYSSEFHSGIDIACDYGVPVKATADGTVVFAGWDGAYGRKISIDHGYGVVTHYGHNSKLLVKVGDSVKKGDVIASSGNSGRSTGTHLHYGTSVNGKYVDPLLFTNSTKER